MKNLFLFLFLLSSPWLIQSQTLKTSVFSSGGGAFTGINYTGFGVFGQPLSVGTTSTNYQSREGFIFAQQNILTVTIAADQTICHNTAADTLTSVIAGAEGVVTCQWQVFDGAAWIDLTSATSTTCDPGILSASKQYRLLVNDRSGVGQVISNTVSITVKDAFTTGAIATTGEAICYNEDPGVISNITAASGGGGSIGYQWQSSLNGTFSDAVDIGSATGTTYDPPVGLTSTTTYRRLAKNDSCNTTFTPSSGTWTVTVDPSTAAGSVTGGTAVCYGTNSTLLTLSGHTGDVTKWQYSTDLSTWIDLTGQTSTTYTAENLTEDTWYRAVVQSGVCSDVSSEAAEIVILSEFSISGYARYENNPFTALNGLKITLKKDGNVHGTPVVTSSTGYYEFSGLDNGNYSLGISSSHPSGQWQTWSGVNNTDYLLVSKHIAGTQLLPVNPPVVRTAASVKLPHPLINTNDANAIRQAAKFPLTGYTNFDTTKWVFSGIDAAHSLNNITVGCTDVAMDIRGLCSGDVNGTYVPPAGVKTLHATSLQLVNKGVLAITDEMVFPVRIVETLHATSLQEIGAITLFLDYDPSQIEITGVSMPGNVDEQPVWHLTPDSWHLNTLYIGWMSTNPVRVGNEETLLLIHTRLTEAFQVSGARCQVPGARCQISFALNDNPLSELADGNGNVIYDAKLSMPDAILNGEMVRWRNGEIVCYPNPVKDMLNVEFVTSNVDAKTGDAMNLLLVTMQGVVVAKQNVADIKTGLNKTTMDLRDLPNGAYLLKVYYEDQVVVRKVIVNR